MLVATIVNIKTKEISTYNVQDAWDNQPDNTPGFDDWIILNIIQDHGHDENNCIWSIDEVKEM